MKRQTYFNKDNSALGRSINRKHSLKDEVTRFLLATVGLGQSSTSVSVRRRGVAARNVFEILQWPWEGIAPGRAVHLVDTLEAKGLVNDVERALGGEYEFTPTYRAFVWAQQQEKG